MKKFLLGVVLSVSAFGYSHAQNETANRPFTLEECVEIAIENNLTLKSTTIQQEITQADLMAAQGQRIPSLSLGLSNNYQWGRSLNPITNLYQDTHFSSLNPSASMRVTIFNGMRINNTISQARANLEAGVYDLEATKNQITLEVINQFINVVFNREQVKVAENQLKTTTEQLERTKKLVEAGSLPLSEQLDIQSQNATNQSGLIDAKNGFRMAKITLAQAMQVPYTDDFTVIEPEFEINQEILTTESTSEIFEVAVNLMPEIKATEARKRGADYGLKISKAGFYPSISSGVNVFSNYASLDPREFSEQISKNISQGLGLSMSIPIFSNFNNSAAVQRARAQKALADVSHKQAENKLRQDIETAYNSALAAEQSYEASLIRVRSLEETFRIAQQRFDLGAINSVDFQVAQNNLFNAQADLLNAKYTYIFRVKVLDFYLGNPINLN